MLQGSVHHPFRDKSGRAVWAYAVTGTPTEMEAYKAAQGEFFWQDEESGTVFFKLYEIVTSRTTGRSTRNLIKKNIRLQITTTGKVVIDDSAAQLALNAAVEAAMVGEIGKLQAMQFMGLDLNPARPVAAPVPTPAPKLEDAPENDPKKIVDKALEDQKVGGSLEDEIPDPTKVAAGA